MKKGEVDISPLYELQKQISQLEEVIIRKNGIKINLDKEKIFVNGGPFLHQNTPGESEAESAAFERDNKKLFDFLRVLDQEINGII